MLSNEAIKKFMFLASNRSKNCLGELTEAPRIAAAARGPPPPFDCAQARLASDQPSVPGIDPPFASGAALFSGQS